MPRDATLDHERVFFDSGHLLVAGVDEVGRGALAGPLVVGAVAVDAATVPLPGLRDSKLLSVRRRGELVEQIPAWCAGHALGVVSAAEIDESGMAAALRVAVSRALAGLPVRPGAVIVDGPVNLAGDSYAVAAFAKADELAATAAAASVLAKVYRDAYMTDLGTRFPAYGFAGHKGYGSAAHRAAIAEHGPCVEHRRSFRLLPPPS